MLWGGASHHEHAPALHPRRAVVAHPRRALQGRPRRRALVVPEPRVPPGGGAVHRPDGRDVGPADLAPDAVC